MALLDQRLQLEAHPRHITIDWFFWNHHPVQRLSLLSNINGFQFSAASIPKACSQTSIIFLSVCKSNKTAKQHTHRLTRVHVQSYYVCVCYTYGMYIMCMRVDVFDIDSCLSKLFEIKHGMFCITMRALYWTKRTASNVFPALSSSWLRRKINDH